MTKTLVMWRHGQTDYNKQHRIQGQIDIPLNETGIAQAQDAAVGLARLPFTRVVSSPLGRALDTAHALADRLGLLVEVDERLMERAFGAWEGLNATEIKTGWPDDFTSWRDFGDPDPATTNVEPRREVGQRVSQAYRDWADKIADGETILFVSHGSATSQGIVTLLGHDPAQWHGLRGLDNCHWAVIQSEHREPYWRIDSYNVGVSDTAISG